MRFISSIHLPFRRRQPETGFDEVIAAASRERLQRLQDLIVGEYYLDLADKLKKHKREPVRGGRDDGNDR